MDTIRGKPYEPIDDRLVAFLYRSDPGHFTHSIAGILYFVLREFVPTTPAWSATGLSFKFSFPRVHHQGTYTHVYKRWAAHNQDAQRLLIRLSVPGPGGQPELPQSFKCAVYCARAHFHQGHAREVIRGVFRYEMLRPRNLDEHQRTTVDDALRELPEAIGNIYLPVFDIERLCQEPFGEYNDNNPARIIAPNPFNPSIHLRESEHQQKCIAILNKNRWLWEQYMRHRRLVGNDITPTNIYSPVGQSDERTGSSVEDQKDENRKLAHQMQDLHQPPAKRQRTDSPVLPSIEDDATNDLPKIRVVQATQTNFQDASARNTNTHTVMANTAMMNTDLVNKDMKMNMVNTNSTQTELSTCQAPIANMVRYDSGADVASRSSKGANQTTTANTRQHSQPNPQQHSQPNTQQHSQPNINNTNNFPSRRPSINDTLYFLPELAAQMAKAEAWLHKHTFDSSLDPKQMDYDEWRDKGFWGETHAARGPESPPTDQEKRRMSGLVEPRAEVDDDKEFEQAWSQLMGPEATAIAYDAVEQQSVGGNIIAGLKADETLCEDAIEEAKTLMESKHIKILVTNLAERPKELRWMTAKEATAH